MGPVQFTPVPAFDEDQSKCAMIHREVGAGMPVWGVLMLGGGATARPLQRRRAAH